jgi:hypothetical protein
MLLREMFEARKNPEQNPKTSVNDILLNYEAKTTDMVAGIKNIFVSFVKIDKLGINPKSDFDTPIGIFGYPLTYIKSTIGKDQPMAALPFAGSERYASIFKVRGNIINVITITNAEVEKYYNRLGDYWAKVSNEDTAHEEVEGFIEEASTQALHPQYAGGRLWYVTMRVAELEGELTGQATRVVWNKVFRSIGIDGAVDMDPATGVGSKIIHENEPVQAVFFSIKAVQSIDRVLNVYSPDVVNMKKSWGYKKHVDTSLIAREITATDDPEEVYQILQTKGFDYLKLVKNPNIRKFVLSRNPQVIKHLQYPKDDEQWVALSNDLANSIPNIKNNLNQKLVLKALQQTPTKENASAVAFSVKNPSEELQIETVKIFPRRVVDFKTTYPSVVQTAMNYWKDSEYPTWLIKIANEFGIKDVSNTEISDLRREIKKLTQEKTQLEDMAFYIKGEIMTLSGEEKSEQQSELQKIEQRLNVVNSKLDRWNTRLSQILK